MTEPENEARKFFDPKNYNTILVSVNDEGEYDADKISNLVQLLTAPANKDIRHDVLNMLRSNSATAIPMVVEAIKSRKGEENKASLVAACWESGLNFSNHLLFFTELAVNEDFLVAIEAVTVIGEMQGPFDAAQAEQSVALVKSFLTKGSSDKTGLLSDLLITLESLSR
jgi:hypothetical protein